MAMAGLLGKELCRTVRHTFGQFTAIAAIVALGCGFFAGIQATTPDMNEMADQHYRETNLMDLQIRSTIGLDEQEVQAVEQLPDVKTVVAGYQVQCYLPQDVHSYSMSVSSMNMEQAADGAGINLPTLTAGTYPSIPTECLMDANFAKRRGYQVGDTITLQAAEDTTLSDYLQEDTFTISGLTNWSMYVSFERGTAQIGTGALDGYLLVDDSAFSMDVYTNLYVTLDSTADLAAQSDAYTTAANDAKAVMEREGTAILKQRVERETADAQAQLTEARSNLETQQAEYAKNFAQLADAYGTEAASQPVIRCRTAAERCRKTDSGATDENRRLCRQCKMVCTDPRGQCWLFGILGEYGTGAERRSGLSGVLYSDCSVGLPDHDDPYGTRTACGDGYEKSVGLWSISDYGEVPAICRNCHSDRRNNRVADWLSGVPTDYLQCLCNDVLSTGHSVSISLEIGIGLSGRWIALHLSVQCNCLPECPAGTACTANATEAAEIRKADFTGTNPVVVESHWLHGKADVAECLSV